MAMTTTQAPAVNFVTRKMTVAAAVMAAPVPLRRGFGPPFSRSFPSQCRTRPVWEQGKAGEDPDGVQRDQRVGVGVDRTSRSAASTARATTP